MENKVKNVALKLERLAASDDAKEPAKR
jgi:hypothetical protein